MSSEPGTEGCQHILVVDDEPDMQQMILLTFRNQIRANEYRFSFALNGYEALKALEQHQEINLVLTDLNMPEMDGLTLIQEMKKFREHIRAVVISAYGDMANIRHAMNRGAFDFLTKPIDLKDLKATVAKTIEEVALIRQALLNRDQYVALKKELEIARKMQLSMMPKLPAQIGSFFISGQIQLSSEVGGDFWDLIPLGKDETLLVLGDCSGHGLSSALVMSAIRHSLRTLVTQIHHYKDLVPALNHVVYREFKGKGSYATMIFVHFQQGDPEIRLLRAGHELPLHRRQNRFLTPDWRGGLPIGIFPRRHNDEWATLCLEAGDELLLVTDGLLDGLPQGQMALEEVLALPNLSELITAQSLFEELGRAVQWQNVDDASVLRITLPT